MVIKFVYFFLWEKVTMKMALNEHHKLLSKKSKKFYFCPNCNHNFKEKKNHTKRGDIHGIMSICNVLPHIT